MPPNPIGGFFESPSDELLTGPGLRLPESAALVQSGRQALALVADALEEQDSKVLHVPDYLCDSMLEAFAERGWAFDPYGLDDDLQPLPGDLAERSGEVWLLAPYFGRHLPAAVTRLAERSLADGGIVILDLTHCVLHPDPTPSTFRAASLRKLLPLPEGGYVTGLSASPAPAGTSVSDEYLAAAHEKADALSSHGDTRIARERHAESERLIEASTTPRRIDHRAADMLSVLNVGDLATRRRRNAETLVARLAAVAGIRPLAGIVDALSPAYLTCRVDEAAALQSTMASEGIFCPIHWPRPNLLSPASWPRDLISLPIDHRYDASDMNRMGDAIAHHLESRPA